MYVYTVKYESLNRTFSIARGCVVSRVSKGRRKKNLVIAKRCRCILLGCVMSNEESEIILFRKFRCRLYVRFEWESQTVTYMCHVTQWRANYAYCETVTLWNVLAGIELSNFSSGCGPVPRSRERVPSTLIDSRPKISEHNFRRIDATLVETLGFYRRACTGWRVTK